MPCLRHYDGLITRDGIRIPPDQLVKKGDILIVLQNDELDGQIEEAEASIQKQKNMQGSKQEEILRYRIATAAN